jgi:hypothetical protein
MKRTDAQGIDSYVVEFKKDSMVVTFDFGPYSNNFSDWPPDTQFEAVIVDGRPGKIGTKRPSFREGFSISTQIAFRDPLHKSSAGPHLSIHAECQSQHDAETARAIFKSVTFTKAK